MICNFFPFVRDVVKFITFDSVAYMLWYVSRHMIYVRYFVRNLFEQYRMNKMSCRGFDFADI